MIVLLADACGTADADGHILHSCSVKNVYADEGVEGVFG